MMKVSAIFIALIAGSFACISNACAQDKPKVTGSADFCVETSIDHTLQCEYGTMEQCQNDIKSSNLVCVTNPH
jgi:hypothetical protein